MPDVLHRLLLALCLLLATSTSGAAPLAFDDPAQEARFHALTAELRCVQCHNQSLADSDALIAQDMRRQVLSLMQQGHSDAQIKDWLVQRYGAFLLYRPQWQGHTLWLWLIPVLLLLTGAALVWRTVRRRPVAAPPSTSDDPEAPSW